MYYLCLAALLLVVLVVHTTLRTRTGRVLRATRDNPRAAAAMAVPTARAQLAGFVLAGVIAGSAGALHATLLRGVGYQTYPVATSILVFSMAVIGGISSLPGTLIGVAFVQGLILAVPRLALVFTGAALLVVLYAAPGGIGQLLERVRDVAVRAPLARRRGIDLVDGFADGSAEAGTGASRSYEHPVVANGTPGSCADTSGMLHVDGLTASYGSLQVLFGVDLDVQRGRDRRPARHQRRRQVDRAAGRGRPRPGDRRHGLPRRRRPVRRADRPDRGVGLRAHAGRAGRVPDAHRRRQPAAGDLAAAFRPGGRGGRPGGDARPVPGPAGAASGSWPGTCRAASSRCCRWPWPSSPGRRCCASTSCPSGWPRPWWPSSATGCGPSTPPAPPSCSSSSRSNVALLLAERAVFLEKGEVRFRGPTADLLERPDLLRSVFIGAGRPEPEPVAADPVPHAGGPPRLPRHRPALRRLDRPRRRRPRRRPRHGRRDHRPQRRRQDDAVRRHLRVPRPRRRSGAPGRRRRRPTNRRTGGPSPGSAGRSRKPGCTRRSPSPRPWPWRSNGTCPTTTRWPRRSPCRRRPTWRRRSPNGSTEVLALLGLTGYRNHRIADLSTGTRRIVELACVLAQDPAVLLLDEPSAGVAQRETEALARCCAGSGKPPAVRWSSSSTTWGSSRRCATSWWPWSSAPSSPGARRPRYWPTRG